MSDNVPTTILAAGLIAILFLSLVFIFASLSGDNTPQQTLVERQAAHHQAIQLIQAQAAFIEAQGQAQAVIIEAQAKTEVLAAEARFRWLIVGGVFITVNASIAMAIVALLIFVKIRATEREVIYLPRREVWRMMSERPQQSGLMTIQGARQPAPMTIEGRR